MINRGLVYGFDDSTDLKQSYTFYIVFSQAGVVINMILCCCHKFDSVVVYMFQLNISGKPIFITIFVYIQYVWSYSLHLIFRDPNLFGTISTKNTLTKDI